MKIIDDVKNGGFKKPMRWLGMEEIGDTGGVRDLPVSRTSS